MGIKLVRMEGISLVANREVIYQPKFTMEHEDDGYRFQFVCGLCDWHYTTGHIGAGAESDAIEFAKHEARPYFNGCRKCGRWICDEHYDMDKMVCAECATSSSRDEISGNRALQKKSRRPVFTAMAAIFIVAIFGLGTIIAFRGNPEYITFENGKVPLAALPLMQMEESAMPYTGTLSESVTAEGVKIPGYTGITIPAETTDVQLLLFNPADNECDLMFEIVLDGETLYKSGLVAPGMCVEDITLTRGLAQGEYQAVLTIRSYEPEGDTQTSSTNVGLNLLAERGDSG